MNYERYELMSSIFLGIFRLCFGIGIVVKSGTFEFSIFKIVGRKDELYSFILLILLMIIKFVFFLI